MRLLVYSSDVTCAQWVRETLLDFGRGMHIFVSSDTEVGVLEGNWSYIIVLGDIAAEVPQGRACSLFSLPTTTIEQDALRRQLWTLYRDTLYDLIGNKCCCGLYDTCHCH